VAVCDRNAEALDLVRRRYGDRIAYFQDAEGMLRQADPDGVVVATNDPDHAQPTLLALEQDKHCLLEKPMAQTLADCDRILLAAAKSSGKLMLGYELRHCVLFEEMRRLLDRGDIGTVKLAWVVDNVSVGGQSFYHGRRRRKAFVRSLLLQKGCHSIDLLNWFVGSRPRRVYASTGLDVFGGDEPADKRCRDCGRKDTCPYFVADRRRLMDHGGMETPVDDGCVYAQDIDVPDNGLVLIDYHNGVRATYAECHFTPEYTREFTLVGDKGKMYGFYQNEEFAIRVTYRHSDKQDTYAPRSTAGGHGGGDLRLQDHFLDCILQGADPDVDGWAGRDSAAVALAAQRSAELGMPVDIPDYPAVEGTL